MITIRKARLADLPELGVLEKEFSRDERNFVLSETPRLKPYIQRTPDRDRIVGRWMRGWIRSRNALVLIAEKDGKPAGFSTASAETNKGIYGPMRFGFIGFVFVRRQYRGRGISSLMMKELLAWFAKRKIKHVSLSVMAGNRSARAIWEKWGFCDFSVFAWKLD